MKATTCVTIDVEVLARAKKDIENFSEEFENFLRAELDLNQGVTIKDKLSLARLKLANIVKETTALKDERNKLKRENEALKSKIEKLELKFKKLSDKTMTGFIHGDFYTKERRLGHSI